jgi:hypothetical protein
MCVRNPQISVSQQKYRCRHEPEVDCRRQLLPQPLPPHGSRIYNWRPASQMPASGANANFTTVTTLLCALLRLHFYFCVQCNVTRAATCKLRKPSHTHLERRARFARCSVAPHVKALQVSHDTQLMCLVKRRQCICQI